MKKQPWGLQPAHRSPNITVAQAIRAFRKVEADKAVGKRGRSRATEVPDLPSTADGTDRNAHACSQELRS